MRRRPDASCSSRRRTCRCRRCTNRRAPRSRCSNGLPAARSHERPRPRVSAPATLQNDTLLRALRREPTAHVPVWLMRQAGRYLPEYAALRARAGSFMALATTPSLATEVTLQPLARFDLDAAILFSDILTVPDAMGLGLTFTEGEGPRFERPLRNEWEVRNLFVPDPDEHL